MVIIRKSLDELNRAAFEHLATSTPITALSPGSTARGMIEAVNRNVADLYDVLDLTAAQTFVSMASGAYLDLIGRMLGVERRSEVGATVVADDRVLRFYVEGANSLGQELNHPTDSEKGRVPGGTEVYSRDGVVTYTVIGDHDFPVMAREAWVGASASATGVAGNVGRGELTTHNLGNSDVLVTNDESVRTGTKTEEDESYRLRITNQVLVAQSANETAVRLATLSIPGVADTILVPGVAGAGSFRVVLIPFGNRVPLQTLLQVRNTVQSVAAYGVRVIVEEPDYVPVSMTVKVHTEVQEAERPPLFQRVENAIRAYVGDLRPSERFVPNRLRSVALTADRDVLDISIRELCLNHRPTLLAEYHLGDDEVLIPDSTVTDPIRVL